MPRKTKKGTLPKMSSFQAEYKQRKLRIKGLFTLSIENTDQTELEQPDFTTFEEYLADKITDVVTEYLSKDETLELIDKERFKISKATYNNS